MYGAFVFVLLFRNLSQENHFVANIFYSVRCFAVRYSNIPFILSQTFLSYWEKHSQESVSKTEADEIVFLKPLLLLGLLREQKSKFFFLNMYVLKT